MQSQLAIAPPPGMTMHKRYGVPNPIHYFKKRTARSAPPSPHDVMAGDLEPSEKHDATVWLVGKTATPLTIQDVPAAAALLSIRFKSEPFTVRSRRDLSYGIATDAPVLDLSGLTKIEVDTAEGKSTVVLEAGVTVSKLESTITEHGLNLGATVPIEKTESTVIAVALAKDSPLGPLVSSVSVVTNNGTIESSSLADAATQLIVRVELTLAPAAVAANTLLAAEPIPVTRWFTRHPSAPELDESVLSSLPADAVVTMFKIGYVALPFLTIRTAAEWAPKDSLDNWKVTPVFGENGVEEKRRALIEASRLDLPSCERSTVEFPAALQPSLPKLAEALAKQEPQMWIEIQGQTITAFYDPSAPPEGVLHSLLAPAAAANALMQPSVALVSTPVTSFTGFVAVGAKAPVPQANTVIKATLDIDGKFVSHTFAGDVYDQSSPAFAEKRHQYATTSFDSQMMPQIIAYPTTVEDVRCAILYASDTSPEGYAARRSLAWPSGKPLKVMARSGGHQYCGVSCDNDALILSMDHFSNPGTRPDFPGGPPKLGEPKEGKHLCVARGTRPDIPGDNDGSWSAGPPGTTVAVVGVGNRLVDIATFFSQNHVTIPHGECPTVGIGGHAQTGGYGHLLRSFGLCLDYLYGFTIVTADGKCRYVTRDSEGEDGDLFWAVCGGSPGAFGVTMDLVFHPIADTHYPKSTAYQAAVYYSDAAMEAALSILQDFASRDQKGEDDPMAIGDIDLMMTFENNKVLNVSVILFEMVCKDMANAKAYAAFERYIQQFERSLSFNQKRVAIPLWRVFDKFGGVKPNGKTYIPLSQISLGFTRSSKRAEVTKDGRENARPYNKVAYGSSSPIQEGFVGAFGKLLHDLTKDTDDVHCVFQFVAGGGALSRNGKEGKSSISHRDAHVSSVVFDLFRPETDKAIAAAVKYQRRFEFDVVDKYMTAPINGVPQPKVMAQWASHGDLDMSKEEVWEKYFDIPEDYHRLRAIKAAVDPQDTFHSRFTIRPASSSSAPASPAA